MPQSSPSKPGAGTGADTGAATGAETGQVSRSAAEIYDTVFVPALFGQFAPRLADAAQIRTGERVLDVGCGTGIAAIAAKARTGPSGAVTGVDINDGMLARARLGHADIAWTRAAAEALPFEAAKFDAVLCQFALMFLEDRAAALREMVRVTRPGGRIALLVWAAVEDTPGYRDLIPLLRATAGDAAADALTAPFVLGDRDAVAEVFAVAGLAPPEPRALTGTARHPSLDAWLDTELGGWTLGDLVTPEAVADLKRTARDRLAEYVGTDGRVAFPAPAWLYLMEAR